MIWIVLPAYDEEASLPILLPRLDEEMRRLGLAYRIIVVDDGSEDRTPEILAGFAAGLPLDVIRHPMNRGLGETERDGFEYVAARCAREDVVIRVEGDATHDPEYIVALLAKIGEGYDVVNTSRFAPGGGQIGVDGYRTMVSWAANLFMKVVFPISNVRDYSCGFRAYRGAVLMDAVRIFGNHLIQLRGLGFTSTLEIIVKLHLLGCRFAEIPFVLRYDRKAGPSRMVTSVTTLGYLLMAMLYHWPFGGWSRRSRGLAALYRASPADAVDRFNHRAMRRRVGRLVI